MTYDVHTRAYLFRQSTVDKENLFDKIETWGQCYKPFRCSTLGWALALLTNIRLDWKGFPGTNTSLLRKFVNYRQKSFITLSPGVNVIELSFSSTVFYAVSMIQSFLFCRPKR